MKTNHSTAGNRQCSRQVCIDCFIESGCLHMSHAFDIPDTWDIKQADGHLFKKKKKPSTPYILKVNKAVHTGYSLVHS